MNILITTSPVVEATSFSTIEKTPPLGLGYLIVLLRREGHRVFFKDYFLSWLHTADLEDFLQQEHIDLLAVSMNTVCFAGGILILEAAQRLRLSGKWSGKIAVGGPHPSVFPKSIPDFVDYVIKGEGEQRVCEIASGVILPRLVEGIQVQDMDSLPFIPYEEFVTLPYNFSNMYRNSGKVFTMNTSRGCPFSCQFCSVGSIWGNRYRFQSAPRVIEEIIRLKREYNAQAIYFREDNFTLNRNRIETFCEGLLAADVKLPWFCETRADTLSRDMVSLMSKAGCRGFYIGAESGSQRVLDYMNKGITLEQVENVVLWAREVGIRCYLSFVLGVPTETDQERYETFLFAHRLNPHSFGTNVFTGIPFSRSYWQLLKDKNYCMISTGGIIYQKRHNELVNNFVGNPDCLVPKGVENAEATLLPLLEHIAEDSEPHSGSTLILAVSHIKEFSTEDVLHLHGNMQDTNVIVINCSGDDDVVLELTKFHGVPGISVRTLRQGQQIEALNIAMELTSDLLFFAEYRDGLDTGKIAMLKNKLEVGATAVFLSNGDTITVEEPGQFKGWLEKGGGLDPSLWACRSRIFRDVGGCESVYGDAHIFNMATKFLTCGSIELLAGGSTINYLRNGSDYAFFLKALTLRIRNDVPGLSVLVSNRRAGNDRMGYREEAVLSYFFGRVRMRSKRFGLARKHFKDAFRKNPGVRYAIYWVSTFLPSSSYSVIANFINKLKRI